MAQNVFLLLLFLFKSSPSMYFPFVTFVTLISTETRKILFLLFHIVNLKRIIYHLLCLRYMCYVCNMVLDDPEVFLVTSVSVQVITLNVFSIRYVCNADFSSLSMYIPFVIFVTLISTWTRKILLLPFHIVNG